MIRQYTPQPRMQITKRFNARFPGKVASMFLFAEKRIRSPLETQLLQSLCNESPFDILWFDNPKAIPLDIFRQYGCPDIVYMGVGYGNNGLLYALKSSIKKPFVVFEVADYECFTTEKDTDNRFFQSLQGIRLDMIVSKNINIPQSTNKLHSYIQQVDNFRNASLIFNPWAIDTERYSHSKAKDIDVAFISSINKGWPFHSQRVKIAQALSNLDCNCYVGNVYGDQYIDILQRSKIFVVDTSMRHGLSQKYLEGTACGCMLIGDIPHNQSIFVDKVSMVKSDIVSLGCKINHYLAHDKERCKVAGKALKQVKKSCSLKDSHDNLVNTIADQYRRVKGNG